MIPNLRKTFNAGFSNTRYEALIQGLNDRFPSTLDFRVAETPVFIPKELKEKMLSACNYIIDFIHSEDFTKETESSIPKEFRVAGEEGTPSFIVFDFGICRDESGNLTPKLIELQGFPTLFAHQVLLGELMHAYASVPEGFSDYLSGYQRSSYLKDLKEIILGGYEPDEVILMEIYPERQKTRIDFACTEEMIGIKTVCYTRIIEEDGELFYEREGRKIRIRRIFNRMIMDDLQRQMPHPKGFDLTKPCDVEWVQHPNWYYRISKYILPFLDHECVPTTFFLNEIKQPLPLELFVLKPLYSFAGMGVIIDVSPEDPDRITDPENWILQKKVRYAPAIQTPEEPCMVEVRIICMQKPGADKPVPAQNLVRISKGKMTGTRYNLNKEWVGGTIGYFEI
jgi:hypothetical protein